LFAKFKIVLQLAVVVGHTTRRVPQPEMDEVLRDAVSSKMRNAEAAKSVTTTHGLIEILQNWVKSPAKDI